MNHISSSIRFAYQEKAIDELKEEEANEILNILSAVQQNLVNAKIWKCGNKHEIKIAKIEQRTGHQLGANELPVIKVISAVLCSNRLDNHLCAHRITKPRIDGNELQGPAYSPDPFGEEFRMLNKLGLLSFAIHGFRNSLILKIRRIDKVIGNNRDDYVDWDSQSEREVMQEKIYSETLELREKLLGVTNTIIDRLYILLEN